MFDHTHFFLRGEGKGAGLNPDFFSHDSNVGAN